MQPSLGKEWEKSKATLAPLKWPEALWSYFGVTLISIVKVCVFGGLPGCSLKYVKTSFSVEELPRNYFFFF